MTNICGAFMQTFQHSLISKVVKVRLYSLHVFVFLKGKTESISDEVWAELKSCVCPLYLSGFSWSHRIHRLSGAPGGQSKLDTFWCHIPFSLHLMLVFFLCPGCWGHPRSQRGQRRKGTKNLLYAPYSVFFHAKCQNFLWTIILFWIFTWKSVKSPSVFVSVMEYRGWSGAPLFLSRLTCCLPSLFPHVLHWLAENLFLALLCYQQITAFQTWMWGFL